MKVLFIDNTWRDGSNQGGAFKALTTPVSAPLQMVVGAPG
jgi:hypothetical protein